MAGYGDILSTAGSGLMDIYKIKQDERQKAMENARANAAEIRASQNQARDMNLDPYRIKQQQQNVAIGEQELAAGAEARRAAARKLGIEEEGLEDRNTSIAVIDALIDKNNDFKKSDFYPAYAGSVKEKNIEGMKEAIGQWTSSKESEKKRLHAEKIAGQKTAATATKAGAMNPTLQKAKDKRLEDFIAISENNPLKLDMISQAEGALDQIPTGLIGKAITTYKEKFDPNDPVLGAWQKVKMVLTDAQLMNTAKTKGAISDKEMDLFSKAAANDTMPSPQKIAVVFSKLKNLLGAEERAAATTYQRLYNEDPYEVIGRQLPASEASKSDSLLPPDKTRRLAELRAKKAAGTLGR